jgi:hypothetical protein
MVKNGKLSNSQNYAQKPQQNCAFMNSASELSSLVIVTKLLEQDNDTLTYEKWTKINTNL